jgi:serine/threonine protein kinase
MSAPQGPIWKGDKCISTYVWEDAPSPSTTFCFGKQADHVALSRKRDRRKRTISKEVYVCKSYQTSGVKPTGISGPKFIHREWCILSSIHHQNIVAYEDFSYDPNRSRRANLYLEYCPGGDLSRHLESGSRDDRLHFSEGLQVLEQLTQALLYVHHGISREGEVIKLARPVLDGLQPEARDEQAKWVTILHRDIKPANSKVPKPFVAFN